MDKAPLKAIVLQKLCTYEFDIQVGDELIYNPKDNCFWIKDIDLEYNVVMSSPETFYVIFSPSLFSISATHPNP